jgi:putative solute:sodium symporter small subunit
MTRREPVIEATTESEARGETTGQRRQGEQSANRQSRPSINATFQEDSVQSAADMRKEYWRRNLRITGILLVIWFFITYVLGFFARELSFNFFGWPFSFWVGAQGALVLYVLIIWFYGRYMNNLDNEFGVQEGEEQ